jgi:hypothetical protein
MLTGVGVGCWVLAPPFSFLPLPLSSPICTSLPPYEQLLIAEESCAVGVVVSPCSCRHPVLVVLVLFLVPMALASLSSPPLPPLCLLARRHRGDDGRPPCEKGLAVVGAGCWGAVSSSPACCVPHHGCRCHHSTRDPPHNQLLMRLGVGGASSVTILGRGSCHRCCQ